MFTLASPRKPRRPGLTPMIDVVFLLLVFFMLAARFGLDSTLELGIAAGQAQWQGPPRLIEVTPQETRLNGTPHAPEAIIAALDGLSQDPARDTVLIRARDGASLQQVVTLMERLRAGGYGQLMLVEQGQR